MTIVSIMFHTKKMSCLVVDQILDGCQLVRQKVRLFLTVRDVSFLQSYLREVFDGDPAVSPGEEEQERCFTLGIDSSTTGTVLGKTDRRADTLDRLMAASSKHTVCVSRRVERNFHKASCVQNDSVCLRSFDGHCVF